MLPRSVYIAIIRARKYVFKREADKVFLYRQKGTGRYIGVPQTSLVGESTIRSALRKDGASEEEIDNLLQSYKKPEGES